MNFSGRFKCISSMYLPRMWCLASRNSQAFLVGSLFLPLHLSLVAAVEATGKACLEQSGLQLPDPFQHLCSHLFVVHALRSERAQRLDKRCIWENCPTHVQLAQTATLVSETAQHLCVTCPTDVQLSGHPNSRLGLRFVLPGHHQYAQLVLGMTVSNMSLTKV